MDFDPRDFDSRDDEPHFQTSSRGGRSGSSDRDRDDDWSQPAVRPHDRMAMTRDRSDAAPVLEVPSGKGQTDTDRIAITIRAGPTEIATIEHAIARPRMPSGDMCTCLAGQIASAFTTAIGSTPCAAPNPGRSRPSVPSEWSPVDAGLGRERELEHDLQVYRAYEQAEDRLLDRGAHIERVVLEHELKSEYQRWLHARDKDHDDYDGDPDRTPDEIREWAHEHDLPYFDDEVHFPDVRVEYQEPDGRWEREDIEVVTPHYRGAHGASVARAGFSCYSGSSLRLSTRGAGRRGGRNGGLAEEMWR